MPLSHAFLPALAFFGVGDQEMVLIMAAVLIFFGGKRMPEFAKGLGKAVREFRKATSDVEREFKRVLEEAENPPPPPPPPRPAGTTPVLEAGHALPAAPEPPPSPPHSSPEHSDEGHEYHADI